MRFVFRALLGLTLFGCAALVQAQAVNVAGTARGIPFAPNCNTTNGVNFAFTGGQVALSFACNGIAYSCMAMPLPEDETQVFAMTLGSPNRLKLNCGGATTITGIQTYIADFYASLQQFIDTPPPGGPSIPDRMCISLQGSTVSAIDYDPNSRRLSYTCTTGTQSVASGCFMTSAFGYDSGGGTLIVPDCIDATNPLDSPYLLLNGYEGNDV
jgi:hypothetical protein